MPAPKLGCIFIDGCRQPVGVPFISDNRNLLWKLHDLFAPFIGDHAGVLDADHPPAGEDQRGCEHVSDGCNAEILFDRRF